MEYLAFKVVNNVLGSCFAEGVLYTLYQIGKTHTFPEGFPTYLIPEYAAHSNIYTREVSYSRVLLVKVAEEDLKENLPWCALINKSNENLSLYDIRKFVSYVGGLGATRIAVLEEVNQYEFETVDAAMKFYENKYQLKRAL